MSDDFRTGLLAQDENSISDIRRFFEEGARPLEEREFILFWQSLSEEDKNIFKRTPLH
jgi:hypothetical protein